MSIRLNLSYFSLIAQISALVILGYCFSYMLATIVAASIELVSVPLIRPFFISCMVVGILSILLYKFLAPFSKLAEFHLKQLIGQFYTWLKGMEFPPFETLDPKDQKDLEPEVQELKSYWCVRATLKAGINGNEKFYDSYLSAVLKHDSNQSEKAQIELRSLIEVLENRVKERKVSLSDNPENLNSYRGHKTWEKTLLGKNAVYERYFQMIDSKEFRAEHSSFKIIIKLWRALIGKK